MDPDDQLARENLRFCNTELAKMPVRAATPDTALEPAPPPPALKRRGSARRR